MLSSAWSWLLEGWYQQVEPHRVPNLDVASSGYRVRHHIGAGLDITLGSRIPHEKSMICWLLSDG